MSKNKLPSFFDRLTADEKLDVDQMLAGKPVVTPTVHITEFTSRYLPLLYNFYLGAYGVEEISKYRTIWINEVAVNGYNEVHVLDNSDNVIAVVPPLYGKVQYVPKDKSFSISDTLGKYKDIKIHRGSTQADRHLKGTIGTNINRGTNHNDRWTTLFEQFKCGDTKTVVDDKVKKSDFIPFNDDLDMTYEP